MRRLLTFALLLCSAPAWAYNTWYISTTGSDSNAGTSAGAAFATFPHSLAAMSSCDTLIVENGYYYDWINTPPTGNAGSTGCYTTIQCATSWACTVDDSTQSTIPIATLYIASPHGYVEVYGIKFASSPAFTPNSSGPAPGGAPIFINYADHVKLIKTAGFNTSCGGNTGVYVMDGATNILVEDSHAWGCGRYKFEAYQSQNIIFRHDVCRHDYHDMTGWTSGNITGTTGWGRQSACFAIYSSGPFRIQNPIVLDSGVANQSTGNMYGAVWLPDDDPVNDAGSIEGPIFLNLQENGTPAINDAFISGDSTAPGTRIVTDGAFINVDAGYSSGQANGSAYPVSVVINHSLFYNMFGPHVSSSTSGVGTSNCTNVNFTQNLTENSVIQGANIAGITDYMTSNYNIFYGNTANFGDECSGVNTPTAGANDLVGTNPALLYPVRVEAGTPGYGTASDGGNIGPTILYRWGTPGANWGDTGWDTLTSIPLWPWSDEATIKTDMASFSMTNPVAGGTISGARGFAASGTGLYGGPITLTSYVWESLGTALPPYIYSSSPTSFNGVFLSGGSIH